MTALEKRNNFFENNRNIYSHLLDIRFKNGGGSQDCSFIKQYAIENTEFYSRYKISDMFPVMSKLDYINNRSKIVSKEIFDSALHLSKTSGSTGIPFEVVQDKNKRDRTIADLKVFGEYALYPSHEKMLQLRAYNGAVLDRTVDEIENIWRYDISKLNNDNIDELIEFILQWKPTIIFGYTSTMETIANYILNNHLKCDFGCKSILVGAEMLSDEIADKIVKVFKCPLFDRYSNMEMGIYAQKEYNKGHYKLNNASYYFEFLKLDSDEPADENELCRIVVTDLYNHAFPMIRYDTGDLCTYIQIVDEIYIKDLYGRRLDSIYDSVGSLINPHTFTRILRGISGILQWQFIQYDKAKYELIYVISEHGKLDLEDVRNRILSQVGNEAMIKFSQSEKLAETKSSKRKAIINVCK